MSAPLSSEKRSSASCPKLPCLRSRANRCDEPENSSGAGAALVSSAQVREVELTSGWVTGGAGGPTAVACVLHGGMAYCPKVGPSCTAHVKVGPLIRPSLVGKPRALPQQAITRRIALKSQQVSITGELPPFPIEERITRGGAQPSSELPSPVS